MPIRDPRSGDPLVFPDKTAAFIEVASPDSERHRRGVEELARLKRERDPDAELSEEQKRVDGCWLIAHDTISWNIKLDGQAVECTLAKALEFYTSTEFAFLAQQADNWQVLRKNFMKPLPTKSGDTAGGKPLEDQKTAG